MSNLVTRALSGAVYVALIVLGVMCDTITLILLGYLLAVLSVTELRRLEGFTDPMTGIDVIGVMILVSAPVMWSLLPLWLVYLIARLTGALYSARPNAMRSLSCSLMTQVYIGVPLMLMVSLGTQGGFDSGRWLVLAMFLMLWVNDTGAYLVGSNIGRHRLMERISPKKSVEGFVGGLVFAVGLGVALHFVFPSQWPQPWWQLGLMGLVVGIFGTLGDLVESRFKREAGVKDSGTLIPGHGGILDRIDSLLLAAPTVYLLFWALDAGLLNP